VIEKTQVKDAVPFRLILFENLTLSVITDNTDVDEASDVELLGAELRHVERFWRKCRDCSFGICYRTVILEKGETPDSPKSRDDIPKSGLAQYPRLYSVYQANFMSNQSRSRRSSAVSMS
jgi:hypothetical protein